MTLPYNPGIRSRQADLYIDSTQSILVGEFKLITPHPEKLTMSLILVPGCGNLLSTDEHVSTLGGLVTLACGF